jgi:predicted nucleotide-binding protein
VTGILDQQLVAHLYAATDGPDAVAAYSALTEIWRGCQHLFGITRAIPGTGLPSGPPAWAALPGTGEAAVAAAESPGADCQAVLRVHHDVLSLSVVLAPPEPDVAPPARHHEALPGGVTGTPADNGWGWWRDLDHQWGELTERHAGRLLGEARLYLARVNGQAGLDAADHAVYRDLARYMPGSPPGQAGGTAPAGVSLPGPIALWEAATEPDERRLRRLVLAIAPDADPAAFAWAWSQGGTAIPPLARYLLHAAKLRYQLRVWQRDGQARQVRGALDAVAGELRRLGASDAAQASALRLRRAEALLLGANLRDLRLGVEIAAVNMARSLDMPGLLAAGGPFADDAALSRSLLERLDDEVAYLERASERATVTADLAGPDGSVAALPGGAAGGSPRADGGLADDGRRRRVFIVHGRDSQALAAVSVFLRFIDLQPVEWERAQDATGKASPYVAEVLQAGLAISQAVIVLMTPDDVVRLHPDLWSGTDTDAKAGLAMQARPNVLIELGMALVSHPDATVVLLAGNTRLPNDLGGVSFVRVTDTPACRQKIALRLQAAGCAVDLSGGQWLTAGDFGALAAHQRVP